MIVGEVELKYKGRNPLLFASAAIGAGIGAVVGYSKSGPLGAVLGAAAGGATLALVGLLLESLLEFIEGITGVNAIRTLSMYKEQNNANRNTQIIDSANKTSRR